MTSTQTLRISIKSRCSRSHFRRVIGCVLPFVSLCLLTLLFVFSTTSRIANASQPEFSRLWGQSGELWDSKGRLPDFSYAGYHKGNDPIPNPPVKWNAQKDFGAKGDGVTDDTKAFKEAIAKGGVIFIPEGRYKITRRLNLKSNTILRGAGQDKTILYFPQHLTDAEGKSERSGANGHIRSTYSFTGGFLSADGNYQEVGIENLTIEFPKTKHRGHLRELGYNGIYFAGGVSHSWVRNVTIRDFDYGINFHRDASYCTAIGIRLTGRGGHHGFNLTDSHHNLFTDFKIENTSVHDFTVSSGAHHNVVSNGTGVDITFDHHGKNPHENLFSNIDAGEGSRPWKSGGGGAPYSGPLETFWNVRKSNGSGFSRPPGFSGTGRGKLAPELNMIGSTTFEQIKKEKDEWIEEIKPSDLFPQDLHLAQLAKRLGLINLPPTAVIATLNQTFQVNETLTLDGTGSTDPDGDLLTYDWDLGDGTTTTAALVPHAYQAPGSYLVSLTVSDGEFFDTATVTIEVSSSSKDPDVGETPEVLPAQSIRTSDWQGVNVPANTQDTDLTTRWSAEGDGQWIEYDLGSDVTVHQVAIAWFRGNLRTSSFAIDVSTSGTDWTEVYRGDSSGDTLGLQTHPFTPVPARFVRIVGFGNSHNRWNSITEVEISGVESR